MKDTLPVLRVRRGGWKQRTHLRGWGGRVGGWAAALAEGHTCALGGEATPARARRSARAAGGVAGREERGFALGARLPARGGGARTRRARRARPPGWGCAQPRAPNAWVVKRIFGTKAEPQRIVATRPLCRVQHPVPHSSRLQGIHRVGPVTCDRVRLRPKLGVLAAERPSR